MQDAISDRGLFGREFKAFKERSAFFYRKRANFRQRLPADAHVASFLPQASAFAIGTERIAAVLRQENTYVQLIFLGFQPLEESAHTGPIALAVNDGPLLRAGQLIEGLVHRNPFRFAKLTQLVLRPLKLRLRPRLDRTFAKT